MRITGGCHCGAIRYEVNGDSIGHALCHCGDCRRHAGAPMVGWAMFPGNAVKVMQGEPKIYSSSENGRKSFLNTSAISTPFSAVRASRVSLAARAARVRQNTGT